jgi:hypothetical protein
LPSPSSGLFKIKNPAPYNGPGASHKLIMSLHTISIWLLKGKAILSHYHRRFNQAVCTHYSYPRLFLLNHHFGSYKAKGPAIPAGPLLYHLVTLLLSSGATYPQFATDLFLLTGHR